MKDGSASLMPLIAIWHDPFLQVEPRAPTAALTEMLLDASGLLLFNCSSL